jgi:hypothetical protein
MGRSTRRPSSTPAAESRKLPTHTEHTRRHVGAFFLTHWTKSRSRVTSSTKKAPGTINVSICVLLKVRTESVTSGTIAAKLPISEIQASANLSIARALDDQEDRMTFQSHDPAASEPTGTYPEHDEAETNVRLQRAWEGWLRWSRTPLQERRAFLIRLADLLDERAETYGRLITAEMGKPLPDAIAEIICGRTPPARVLRLFGDW